MCFSRSPHRRFPAAQEGIDAPLAIERGRQRDRVTAAQRLNGVEGLEHVGVAGLDRRGEAQVAECVLMGAVDQSFVRQRCDAVEGIEHLGGRAFEQPATTRAEQRVAAEERAVAVIGDVSERVTGHVHYVKFEAESGQG